MNQITTEFTAADQIDADIAHLRTAFASGKTRSLQWRKAQLKGIIRLIDEQEDAIHDFAAAMSDLPGLAK